MGIRIGIGSIKIGGSLQPYWTPQHNFNKGKLILTFDEVTVSQYNVAFPLFASKGVKATTYIISDLPGTNAAYMTWANLREMHANGWDIQCHTKDHTELTTLTEVQVLAELQGVNDAFAANGLPAPQHHAYPRGLYNSDIKGWVGTMRKTARATDGDVDFFYSTYGDSDKLSLSATWVDNIDAAGYYHGGVNGMTTVKGWMDNANANKGAMILYMHGVSVAGGTYEIATAKISEIIDYAKSIGMDIITMSQLYNLMVKTVPVEATTDFVITKIGTGADVCTLTLGSNEDNILTLDGAGKFYTDVAGTLPAGGSSVWNMKFGVGRTMYIRCPSGVSNLKISRNLLYKWVNWTSSANAASIGGDISRLNSLNYVFFSNNNTLSGDGSTMINLYSFGYYGAGALVFPRVINIPNLSELKLDAFGNCTLTSANVNQLLADFWANKDLPKIGTVRAIDIRGKSTSGAPTGQGITDKAALQAYRSPNPPGTAALWTVTTR